MIIMSAGGIDYRRLGAACQTGNVRQLLMLWAPKIY